MSHKIPSFSRSASAPFLVLALLFCSPLHAVDVDAGGAARPHGITASGLDTAVSKTGDAFDITGGTLANTNLFHSFGKFNIHSGESAAFLNSHGATIDNILARVTGSDYSWINGELAIDPLDATISAANLWLMNPNGVMFGLDASLDVGGSFHVGTADYLKLADGGRFYAALGGGSVLSVTAPESFGFLDTPDSTSAITVSGSHLTVQPGEALSLTGGAISIEENSRLAAAGGRIGLVGVGVGGEVSLAGGAPDTNGLWAHGDITVTDSIIDVDGGGRISIRGEDVILTDAVLSARSLYSEDGQGIEILAADRLELLRSLLDTRAEWMGDAGNIVISAADILIDEQGATGEVGLFTDSLVSALRVGLDIIHTWDEDLVVDLTSPYGTQVRLFSNVGGSGENFTGTVLHDDAAAPIGEASAPFTGAFRPEEPLSHFQGEPLDGVWELLVRDQTPGDQGRIEGWRLEAGPATFAATDVPVNIWDQELAGSPLSIDGTGRWIGDPSQAGRAGSITLDAPRLTLAGSPNLSATSDDPARTGAIDVGVPEVFLTSFACPDGGCPAGLTAANGVAKFSRAGSLVLDGSLGIADPMEGPEYHIAPAWGRLRGDNLFHSFSRFDLDWYESAVFDGPSHVRQIVSRVTGGESSRIDGQLRTSIPGAGLWLMNPAGVVFGPDATLDIDGSFHVTSADYLGLGEDGGGARFYADPDQPTILSLNTPHAFGFLDEGIGPVHYLGASGEDEESSRLYLQTGTLSLVGGEVLIDRGTVHVADSGRINLAAIASPGEVRLADDDLVLAGTGGRVTIRNDSRVRTGDDNAAVFIRGGDLVLHHQTRVENLIGSGGGGGDGGVIDVAVDTLSATEGSGFSASVWNEGGPGRANGKINIHVDGLAEFSGWIEAFGMASPSGVSSSSGVNVFYLPNASDGSEVLLDVGALRITDGAYILGRTFGTGDASDITVRVDGAMELSSGGRIAAESWGSGAGGRVDVMARSMVIDGRDPPRYDTVDTSRETSGFTGISGEARDAGHAREVMVTVADRLSIRNGGAITTSTYGEGNAGGIRVRADRLLLTSEGTLLSEAKDGAGGNAGSLTVDVAGLAEILHGGTISTTATGTGDAGGIDVHAEALSLDGGAAISSASTFDDPDAGGAGTIRINARDEIRLLNGAAIDTSSRNGGAGEVDDGSIDVYVPNLLYLRESRITTSAEGGQSHGGNIDVDPLFVVLDAGHIEANAWGGDGGNIHITAGNFFSSPDSVIEASSEFGLDGEITLDTPNMNTEIGATALSGAFLSGKAWVNKRCSEQSGRSRFVARGRDGAPGAFDDWLPSPLAPLAAGEAGSEDYRRGDFAAAIRAWEAELVRIGGNTHAGPDPVPAVALHRHLAEAWQALGLHGRAEEALQQALALTEGREDSADRALVLDQLGDLYLATGRWEAASRHMGQGFARAHALGMDTPRGPRTLAAVLNDLGNTLALTGLADKARIAYAKAITLAEGVAGDPDLAIVARLNRLRLDPRPDPGLEPSVSGLADEFNLVFDKIRALPDSYHKARRFLSLADLGLLSLSPEGRGVDKAEGRSHQNAYPETADARQRRLSALAAGEAARIAEELREHGHGLLAHAHGYLGRLHEIAGENRPALEETRRAIFFAQQAEAPENLYRWQWQLGRLLAARGKRREAIAAYREAVWTLTPIRASLLNGFRDTGGTFRSRIRPVYSELADLLLRHANADTDINTEGRAETLTEARRVLETLKLAEMQDFFQSECISAALAQGKAVEAIDPRSAVLYPILLPDRLVLLLNLADGSTHQVVVNVGKTALEATAHRLRRGLQNRIDDRFLIEARQLYDWLIRPVEKTLQAAGVDTLVWVPDGALRTIPISTVQDGERFLVERYAIATVPGLGLIDPRPLPRENARILLTGLSDGVQGFSPLPSVPKEMGAIREIIGQATRLQDGEYTETNVQTALGNQAFSIVHMATHGIFGDNPDNSFLLTHDGRITMNELDGLFRATRFRERPVDLLTLSACQTALGDEKAALGLAGVAMKAGARSVLATLWYVDDEATGLAITEFYRQLMRPELSKAKALQQAQRSLIAQKRFRHPAYWGPFMLLGNWL
uniref:Filamentous hemagglutinin family N-terminal domain-containing protein n=1 Tax=Candidatus Kentrum sp. DK TaxID=2126562 RepID=A0A450T2K2_9GAMM|nr:MAG: filamentous hemagglutinin family N-terminal domain-containing protein [Candidatus Kentron sp. DK]